MAAEDAVTPGGLRCSVTSTSAPASDCFLVSPERKGQQLVRVSEALEPFDGDEPVHALKLGLEACCVLQIVAFAATGREHFKDYSDHYHLTSRKKQGSTIKHSQRAFEVRDLRRLRR